MNIFGFGPGKKNIEEKNESNEKDKKSEKNSQEKIQKSPQMKTVAKTNTKKAILEEDGGIKGETNTITKKSSFRMLPIIARELEETDSDDDEYIEQKFAKILNAKFEDDEKNLNKDEKKRKAREDKSSGKIKDTKQIEDIDMSNEKISVEQKEKYSVADRYSHRRNISDNFPSLSDRSLKMRDDEKTSSPTPTSPRGRPSKAPAFIRNLSQRMSLVQEDDVPQQQGMKTSVGMSTLMLEELLSKSWTLDVNHRGGTGLKNIPDGVLNQLSDLAYMISNNKDFQGRSPEWREAYLQREIGKRFLNLIEQKIGDGPDKKSFESPEKLTSYLRSNFGIIVGLGKNDKRKTVSASYYENSDFHENLMQELAIRMSHHEVDYVFGEKNSEEVEIMKINIERVFVAAMKSEKVEGADNRGDDVTATFKRDFPNSDYYFEDESGIVVKIKSEDEFIKIFKDSDDKKLAYSVSHYCNQNLPIFLKNVMFSRTTKDGSPISVLKLYDGTPLSISKNFISSYTLKKMDDGSFLLNYKGKVDTEGADKTGRNTATLLTKKGKDIERKAVLITNATAEITYQIRFGSDGSVIHSFRPSLKAKGWNHLSEANDLNG